MVLKYLVETPHGWGVTVQTCETIEEVERLLRYYAPKKIRFTVRPAPEIDHTKPEDVE